MNFIYIFKQILISVQNKSIVFLKELVFEYPYHTIAFLTKF